ncbi:hypothetical protein BO94DRAFT_534186 [Aspergillus sclerotioniger CBS 115572]|uniref:Uncharacterized protein n=1 Tax=Aspergillus sclerotioniger CBS 115572 TaxID=1450535 RepID=A0A317WX97_9EURO|nr:hypothetical protein BO94DRAFT_534186 [Aspergillus sclerotioniger CBS 115572]PWY89418.1 hypothetical protein BO94DRAFT_534186 [Aspergillus sclerotioniger CBS 115572]
MASNTTTGLMPFPDDAAAAAQDYEQRRRVQNRLAQRRFRMFAVASPAYSFIYLSLTFLDPR